MFDIGKKTLIGAIRYIEVVFLFLLKYFYNDVF